VDKINFPVLFVISKNLHRRHLTIGQRAAIATEMVPMLHEEAKKRQGERADLHHPSNESLTTSAPTGAEVGRSTEIAAKAVGVGRRTVERTMEVKRRDPGAFEKIKRGEVTPFAGTRLFSDGKAPSNGRKRGRRGTRIYKTLSL
jgi:hypothetical protein